MLAKKTFIRFGYQSDARRKNRKKEELFQIGIELSKKQLMDMRILQCIFFISKRDVGEFLLNIFYSVF